MEHVTKRIFSLLNNWQKLPAYKIEPRVDIFFACFLPDILKDKFEDFNADKKAYIIPEFPLLKSKDRQGKDVKGNTKKRESDKIDYVLFNNNSIYLVELKTDNNSIRWNQAESLEKQKCWHTMLIDILFISIARVKDGKLIYQSRKYEFLISELFNALNITNIQEIYDMLKDISNFDEIDEWPKVINNPGFTKLFPKHKIEPVYIIPSVSKTIFDAAYRKKLDKKYIENIEIIEFNDVINAVEDTCPDKICKNEAFSGECFCKLLRNII